MPRINLITIGDASTGKSSCLHRYIKNYHDPSILTTIGLDYFYKTITLENQKYEVQIFDTCGQERFYSITRSYYQRSSCVLLFCDVSNTDSFLHLNYWYSEIEPYKRPIILLANKTDKHDRVVTVEDLTNFCIDKGIICYETSSITGTNIKEAFDQAILRGIDWNLQSSGHSINNIPEINISVSAYEKYKDCCKF